MPRPLTVFDSRKSRHHTPHRSSGRTARVRTPDRTPADLPCVHRREQIDTRPCNQCGGEKGRPQAVYACALHNECTIHNRLKRAGQTPAVHACLSCDDRAQVEGRESSVESNAQASVVPDS